MSRRFLASCRKYSFFKGSNTVLNNDLIDDIKYNFIPLYLEFTFEFRIVQGMHCYYFEWIQILYWSNQSTLIPVLSHLFCNKTVSQSEKHLFLVFHFFKKSTFFCFFIFTFISNFNERTEDAEVKFSIPLHVLLYRPQHSYATLVVVS